MYELQVTEDRINSLIEESRSELEFAKPTFNFNHEITKEDIEKAIQQSNWAWTDVMVGLTEMGISPTQDDKDRILLQLVKKKIKGVLWKKNQTKY